MHYINVNGGNQYVILKRDKAAQRRFLVQIIENCVILRQMISGGKTSPCEHGLDSHYFYEDHSQYLLPL